MHYAIEFQALIVCVAGFERKLKKRDKKIVILYEGRLLQKLFRKLVSMNEEDQLQRTERE